MSKRVLIAGVLWVVLSVLAFSIDPILGACVLLFGGIGVVVFQLAGTWEQHPDFEARERRRAAKRKAKWEKNKDVRERDAARFAAHKARQAEKARQAQEARQAEEARQRNAS